MSLKPTKTEQLRFWTLFIGVLNDFWHKIAQFQAKSSIWFCQNIDIKCPGGLSVLLKLIYGQMGNQKWTRTLYFRGHFELFWPLQSLASSAQIAPITPTFIGSPELIWTIGSQNCPQSCWDNFSCIGFGMISTSTYCELKAGEENFLNSYIVLLRAGLTCTIKSSPIGWLAGAVWLVAQKDNVGSQKFFFPCFCLCK